MIRDALYADLAGAIVDGTPIDWAAAESSDGEGERGLLDRLKLIASVAALHRHLPQSDAALESATAGVEAPQRWGHLAVLERIGRGAFGEVYRAWDPRLDREVALKLLPAGSTESEPGELAIIEEGRALARVRHPNVVTLYGAEVIDDRVGLWMELVRGRTLEELVVAGKRWSGEEAVALGIELCGAVSAVHAAGLLHRDIKAANVMVADDGRVVLMDFGTGRGVANGGGDAGGAPAPLAGTPLYLAPELFAGAEPSAATDVYSLGVLLYYVVTGSYPVRARNLGELRLAHQSRQRIEVRSARPDLRASLAQVIDRATDPYPRRRYPTAEALAACLLPLERRSSLGAWNRRLAVAAVLLTAIGGIGGAWLVRGRQAAPQGESSDRPLLGGERLAGAGTLHHSAAEPVIVVLPFDDQVNLEASTLVAGTGPDSHHFAEGIADEIIRDLGRVDGLAVRSRYSSFAVGREPRDLREIGERLDADLIVTGSVLRSGERLRIQAQLVDVATDVTIWTKRFDRTLASSLDVFAIVDDIARGIVNELRLALGGGRRRYDVDVETYDLYLRARAEGAWGGAGEALAMFEEVIARDPAFAPAHAGLADAYFFNSSWGVDPGPALAPMRQAAERALELDPLLAEAHAAMGIVHAREFDWEAAERSFQRALALDPTLTPTYRNYSITTLRPLGKLDQADRLLQTALEHDPLSLDLQHEIGMVQFCAERYVDAADTFQRIYAADRDFPVVRRMLARSLTLADRLPEAFAMYEEEAGLSLGLPQKAGALVRAGRRAEAERMLAHPNNRDTPRRAVYIHAALGDLDRAFDALDTLAEENPQEMPMVLRWPELLPLHGDPRFDELREEFELPP